MKNGWSNCPSSVAFLSLVEIIFTHQQRLCRHTSLWMHSSSRMVLRFICVASKLAKHYTKKSGFIISSVHLWTDYMDVIFWLQGQLSRWITFVANRCSGFRDNCPDASWHHESSKSNPADILSRGCSANKLANNTFCWHGPCFLRKTNAPWATFLDPKLARELSKHSKTRGSVIRPSEERTSM